ncbi:16S rRNA (uracil(1498)-N(3))-methyltransferase [Vallicoccus soli]|uniref:Ribosomal RNA small subunit methyltransferase E n=1 Tax=Vallicoccus soli TaxID=2339232 RepID=A0A3A3ZLF9_9ACTN|nr:16S rRNA (uracil(1498)-N(3))-methyltransferase [Vallicoccus soli]RJK97046.1 16S rRNA (uracil(1498)-N(3))-methyltransferase [Vallicoccus soli]
MTPPVFLVEPGTLPPRGRLVLDGAEGRHAAAVRRLQPGEALVLADGAGEVADCVVAVAHRDSLELEVVARRALPAPSPRLVVVQALAKGDRGETAVETMTEVGVDAVVPWAAARSVVQWRGDRGARALGKWRATAREAAKQSRRARVPEVLPLATTAEVAALAGAGTAYVLHEEAEEPLATAPLPDGGDLVLVVGPEGGVAPDELDALAAAGARPVRLGAEVLRTSTAGTAALAVLQVRTGRWG